MKANPKYPMRCVSISKPCRGVALVYRAINAGLHAKLFLTVNVSSRFMIEAREERASRRGSAQLGAVDEIDENLPAG